MTDQCRTFTLQWATRSCSIIVTKDSTLSHRRRMIELAPRDFETLKQLAELAYPEEFCAILLGARQGVQVRVARVMAVRNIHERPRSAYAIEPKDLIVAQREARERNLEIVGFVHSHPDHAAEPSVRDVELAHWPECVWGIVSVLSGVARAVRWFRIRDGVVAEDAVS